MKELGDIEAALASVGDMLRALSPEARWEIRQELRQELAVKLLSKSLGIDGLRSAARNWLLDHFRGEARRREAEKTIASGGRPYRQGPNWHPSWYPPHRDAREFAPFACHGARMMHVKRG
jgi:hypothetical protein